MKRLKWEPNGRGKHVARLGPFTGRTQNLTDPRRPEKGEVHWTVELGPMIARGVEASEKRARGKCSKVLAQVRAVSKVGT